MPHSAKRNSDGTITVHCEKCSSVGINHSMDLQRVSTPENDQKVAAHLRRIGETYEAHEQQVNALIVLKRQGKNVDVQMQRLVEKLEQDAKALNASAPKDESYIIVSCCPWCREPFKKVHVQELEAA